MTSSAHGTTCRCSTARWPAYFARDGAPSERLLATRRASPLIKERVISSFHEPACQTRSIEGPAAGRFALARCSCGCFAVLEREGRVNRDPQEDQGDEDCDAHAPEEPIGSGAHTGEAGSRAKRDQG